MQVEPSVFYLLPGAAENEHGSGIRVIRRRDCGVHPGGVAIPGPHSEGPLQRCDAGELQPPGLRGVLHYQTPGDLQVGARGRTVVLRGRIPNPEVPR
ncbi:hypothetical protein mRhiFer1_009975 [Rhinolophus ferrumequinum]|uniref:Uncharacterized protein n=1 Tax=Rhinolophus ferrumequinum TaxID=59479 RepID=A0A7J7YJT9_RHIFE|nr:hypothetical protein mRhiFer1_009975 [Rhinolophus ferrumequinum]